MAGWDLLVVGGGIVGAAAAYHGARAGARVLLVDRDDVGRATAAGAGIVSPDTDLHHSDAYHDLACRAADDYPALLDSLPRSAGWDRCGMLVVAADEAEAREHDAFTQRALDRQRRRRDVPEALALRPIDAAMAQGLFPALARVERALFDPSAARIDGREVTAALHEAALAHGAERVAGSVTSFCLGAAGAATGSTPSSRGEASPPRDSRRVTGVAVGSEEYAAGAVVVAGGAWSPLLTAQLGLRVPVEPQRGQIAHLGLAAADTAPWPMVSGFRDHYLVAWPGGRVAAGATRESGSGFDPRTTAAGVREVLGEALRLAPGLAEATLLEVRVGLRPLSADGMPILGPVAGWPGLWLATGHGAAGLTLGPYSAKLVVAAALGGERAKDLDSFSLARFDSR